MSINYRILKACDFSPRHKSELLQALNALARPTVARCAALLHRKCRELSIADFPNPFPRDEPDSMLWNEVFQGRTPLTDEQPDPDEEPPKGWPEAWEGDAPEDPEKAATVHPDDAGVPETPLNPDAPPDPNDPNLKKPDLPVMDSDTAPEPTPAGHPDSPGYVQPTPPAPTGPVDNSGAVGPPVEGGTDTEGEPMEISPGDTGPLEEILGDSSGAGAEGPPVKPPTPPLNHEDYTQPKPAPRAVVPEV